MLDNNSKTVENKRTLNHFYNGLFKVTCKVACFLFNSSFTSTKEFDEQINSNEGMLIFCNHLSSLDFLFTSQSILNKNVACVVADNMKFSNKFFSRALSNLKVIYKKQYYMDINCIKNIKQYIENGVSVVICPEGKVSSEGVTSRIYSTTGKLVKMLDCAVGCIKVKGAGLTRPKWAYSIRRGKIESNARMLLNSKDVKKISVDEINQIIQKNLDHDEYKYQQENHLIYHGIKYAEGLERLLYKCPKCGAEFKISSHKDHLKCLNCGNEVVYKKDGKLIPINNGISKENIDNWVAWEKEEIIKECSVNISPLVYKVWLFKGNENTHSYDYIAPGTIKYDGTYIYFDTNAKTVENKVKLNFNVSYMTSKVVKIKCPITVENKYQHMKFFVKNLPSIANIPGDTIDLTSNMGTFRFMFYDQKASTKLVYSIEQNYLIK